MSPEVLASLITLVLVGGPSLLVVAYLGHARRVLTWQLSESIRREQEQRARAVAAELTVVNTRRSLAKAWVRVVAAEGWPPGETHLDAAPSSRPASPPPESRSRA